MQDFYTKAGKLDEAVAIRDTIRQLKAAYAPTPAAPRPDVKLPKPPKPTVPITRPKPAPKSKFAPLDLQIIPTIALPAVKLPAAVAGRRSRYRR